jgi:hypothetical protein
MMERGRIANITALLVAVSMIVGTFGFMLAEGWSLGASWSVTASAFVPGAVSTVLPASPAGLVLDSVLRLAGLLTLGLVAAMVAILLARPRSTKRILETKEGSFHLCTLVVGDDSPADGTTVGRLELGDSVLVALEYRSGKRITGPSTEMRVRAGDSLVVAHERKHAKALERLTTPRARPARQGKKPEPPIRVKPVRERPTAKTEKPAARKRSRRPDRSTPPARSEKTPVALEAKVKRTEKPAPVAAKPKQEIPEFGRSKRRRADRRRPTKPVQPLDDLLENNDEKPSGSAGEPEALSYGRNHLKRRTQQPDHEQTTPDERTPVETPEQSDSP